MLKSGLRVVSVKRLLAHHVSQKTRNTNYHGPKSTLRSLRRNFRHHYTTESSNASVRPPAPAILRFTLIFRSAKTISSNQHLTKCANLASFHGFKHEGVCSRFQQSFGGQTTHCLFGPLQGPLLGISQ